MTARNQYWKAEQHRASFDIARSITAEHARSFYLSAQLLPARQRWSTYGLYGFCRHADNLVDCAGGQSDEVVRKQVEDLKQALLEGYEHGESPDPVVDAYVCVAKQFDIPSHLPLELLEGVQMDIGSRRYVTYDDLHQYCYRVAGVVGLMMTHVLGYSDPAAFAYAEKLGIAMQLTNILRDIDEDRKMDRVYLPQDEMAQFGVTEASILEGCVSPELRALLRYQAGRAELAYEEAEAGIDLLPVSCRFSIRAASQIYHGILDKLAARDFDPFLGRVYVSGSSKAGIVLREAFKSRLPSFRILGDNPT